MAPPRPCRVVFLLQDLKHGGTQSQALALARRLPADRFAVELWTLAGGGDLDPAPVPRVALADAPAVGARAIAALGRALRRDPPDVLVCWTVVPNIWGRLLGRAARVPAIVGNCRGGDSARRQHERWLGRLADVVVCNARAIADDVKRSGVPADRVEVVRNGVEIPERVAPPGAAETVLCVARLVPEKDHATLLEAFAIVRRSRPGARLRIVGDGPERDSVRRAAESPSAPGIEWIPSQADVRPLLDGCAVFALASRVEAMPNAVLEAMASARPVVATAVGGVPEAVEDGRTGILVPPGRPAAMAEAILGLLADPARAAAMGAAGRERAARGFAMPAMVAAYAGILDRCAARAGGRVSRAG